MEQTNQPVQDEKQARAAKEKDLGNEAFQAGRFEEAIQHFTNAIELDPYNHVLYR